jgi:hypothetical protein
MKKQILTMLSLLVLASFSLAYGDEYNKRTDGPVGSEWDDFSSWKWKGNLQFGGQFGAILPSADHADSSFGLGLDADYRPFDLFGIRSALLQGFSSPKATLWNITPLIHYQYSNLVPYAMFGPGIAITNYKETKVKFDVSFGAGADVMLIDHLAFGMVWQYHSLIDSLDLHTLTARIAYLF